jgi:hypothetical protein
MKELKMAFLLFKKKNNKNSKSMNIKKNNSAVGKKKELHKGAKKTSQPEWVRNWKVKSR